MFKELFIESKEFTQEKEDEMYEIFSKLPGFVRAGWDDDGIEYMYKTPKDAQRAGKRMGIGSKYGWVEYFKSLDYDSEDKNVIVGIINK